MKGGFFCRLSLLLTLLSGYLATTAQKPLPEFSVIDKGGGRVVISWVNPFTNLIQVTVQRSYDSIRRFSTIYSAESPELPQNGFTDKVNGGVKVYYRIFYSMQGGDYFFSKSQRPGPDTGTLAITETDLRRDKVSETIKNTVANQPEKKIYVKLADSLLITLIDKQFLRFKDSVIARTKDTLTLLTNDTILLKRYVAPFVFKTSVYVYPDKDGYIVLNLPEALVKKYDLIVTEEDDTPVLEIRQIKAPYLSLDKANFYHGGWYKFELWEDGKMKEKNKFYLAKDF